MANVTTTHNTIQDHGVAQFQLFSADLIFDATGDTSNSDAFRETDQLMLAKALRATVIVHGARTGTPTTTFGIKARWDGTNFDKLPGATALMPAAATAIAVIDIPTATLGQGLDNLQLYVESGSNMDGSNLYTIDNTKTFLHIIY